SASDHSHPQAPSRPPPGRTSGIACPHRPASGRPTPSLGEAKLVTSASSTLEPHAQAARDRVLLEARAELAVVIDEELGVGRELQAEARADERGVAAEGDAGRGEGASRDADERGGESLR